MNIGEFKRGDEITYYEKKPFIPSTHIGLVTGKIKPCKVQVVEAATMKIRWVHLDQLVCWRRPEPDELRLTVLRLVNKRLRYFGDLSDSVKIALEFICEHSRGKVEL